MFSFNLIWVLSGYRMYEMAQEEKEMEEEEGKGLMVDAMIDCQMVWVISRRR